MNHTDATRMIKQIFAKDGAYWERRRTTNALKLFHEAAARVPAYADFLKKQKVNPDKIRTEEDFSQVPPTNKKDYLRQYPLEMLAWDGHLNRSHTYTATSGSTGNPFYFPIDNELAWQGSVIHELFLRNSMTPSKRTLVIVGFGMGVWIGGLFTYRSFELAGKRHGAVSLITPGINKAEIVNALKNIGGQYEEIILTGYPPFIKDILDEMREERVPITKGSLRILFAAEPFGEGFRDHVARQAGITNVYRDTMNIYGSADIGAMAWESPLTILMRRIALKNKSLFTDLFQGARKLPTLAQYHPDFINFEEQQGELYLTGNNAIPLIRYGIGDHGGVHTYDRVREMVASQGIRMDELLQKAGIMSTLHKLPLVYVYERNDFSTTLYGLQIYPEVIREVLVRNPLQKFLTGKLTMLTTFDAKHDQYLEVHLELKKNKKITRTMKERTLDMIVRGLRQQISEFRELHTHLKERALPKLRFWSYGHPTYFKSGGKQKWVKHA